MHVSKMTWRLRLLYAAFCVAVSMTMMSAFPGGGVGEGVRGERSYEVLVPTASYVLALRGDSVDVLRQDGTLLGTMAATGPGKHTTTTTWTCQCHGDTQNVSTTINSKHIDSDLQAHDRIVEAKKRRHPKMPNP